MDKTQKIDLVVLDGRYKLLGPLGKGGMGEVFEAIDLTLNRPCAIKRVGASLLDIPEARERFAREAKLTATLSHPNIVRILDVRLEGGDPYIAMECFSGMNLAERFRENPPALELALAIFIEVIRGLRAAAEKGLVHRDIKPENILVDNEGHVKIIDFGLSRARNEPGGLNLTKTGEVMGTPLYMSPEQCEGSPDIAPASDIYSAGATFFALLAGRPPFPSDSFTKVLLAHCRDPRPDLSRVRPGIPVTLSFLFQRMMAINPAERPKPERIIADFEKCREEAIIARRAPKPTAPTVAVQNVPSVSQSDPVSGKWGRGIFLIIAIFLLWKFFSCQKGKSPDAKNGGIDVRLTLPREGGGELSITARQPESPSVTTGPTASALGGFIQIRDMDEAIPDRATAINRLRDCQAEWIILNYSYSSHPEDPYTEKELKTIREGRPGRKICALLPFADAWSYYPYWRKEWDPEEDGVLATGAPKFLTGREGFNSGLFEVKFWDPAWKKILLQQVNSLLEVGFDGFYLIGVSYLDRLAEDKAHSGVELTVEMRRWILEIVDHARKKKRGTPPVFILEDGDRFAEEPTLLAPFSLFTFENHLLDNGVLITGEELRDQLETFELFRARGKGVVAVEFATDTKKIAELRDLAQRQKFSLLVTAEEYNRWGEGF